LFGHFFGYFFLLLQLAASFLVAEHYARALCRLDEAVNEVKQGKRSWEELVFPDHLGSLGANCRALLQDLKGTERRLQDSHLETVKAMALAMEARDVSTQGHCLRVRYYARRIMESLNLEPAYREAAEAAALLHDIGKIGIPDALLLKRNELTPDEYTRVMMHVDIGAEILRPLSSLKDAVLFVRHHHERFDGSGYPDGLRGEEIPLGSRIIAVADAVDAMRSSRPYRKGLSLEKTLLELRGAKGRHLDPGLVDIAISVLLSSPSRKASEEERLERVALV
jgi:putative nucleotidyltransferase with HDIG domain